MKNVINYSNNGILPFPGKKTGWGAAIFFFTLFWMFWVRTDPVNTLTVSLDQKAKNYRKKLGKEFRLVLICNVLES